jgi:hypothetical protein
MMTQSKRDKIGYFLFFLSFKLTIALQFGVFWDPALFFNSRTSDTAALLSDSRYILGGDGTEMVWKAKTSRERLVSCFVPEIFYKRKLGVGCSFKKGILCVPS